KVDFENLLKKNAGKNIDWFFNTIIDTRKIIDFKFKNVSKTKDSITFTIKNRTQTNVPIVVYGLNNKKIVFKEWFENVATDSTFTIARKDANKIVLNYKNEVPEYNLRNNWNKFSGFNISNRPFKFVFMKDLEDPHYNQILYVPTLTYNLYDGISPGFRFHNKTILDKPFTFDVNPTLATITNTLVGFFSTSINQNYREGSLYNVRYNLSGSYSHYAPNAAYSKINPVVFIRFRPKDLRNNQKELLILRQVFVNREKLNLFTKTNNQNYNVFNAKYIIAKTEITKHYSFSNDFQLSKQFGKLSSELEFRKLFDSNRQINLRFYAGSFLYNTTDSDFFSFALDRPTDYLFDYNYYGRSENTGIFSQQIIIAEGGFKSKLNTPFANQWIATVNGSFNVWNWLEIYGDLGFLKNTFQKEKFVYDSGIRFNLVTDYFELYFPVYSNNGWEITQQNYNQKIRFIVTLEPKILTNLFTRKWF
ncbi:MAG: aminopeptidase, partial [Flavobacterium sp.]|nr:aminopeptidase [Flavobacterium sp.]